MRLFNNYLFTIALGKFEGSAKNIIIPRLSHGFFRGIQKLQFLGF